VAAVRPAVPVAVVTGAAAPDGIGTACARALADSGCDVALLDRRFTSQGAVIGLTRALALELAGELARAHGQLGLGVIQLPAQIDGVYLGAPQLRPVWEEIAHRGLVVFIHPDGVRDPWFQRYSLWNSVGQPIEEARVLCSPIYEGVLEQFPEVPVVVSHGGGYLPHYYGRLDRNVQNMPDSTVNISQAPSAYLRRLYYDTCVYEPSTLSALVTQVGADHILMGSDWPVGEADPIGFVNRCDALDDAQRRAILGGTAARLLGLAA
jgi:aminocarboxymuconate-semialdehyde decarboxylase